LHSDPTCSSNPNFSPKNSVCPHHPQLFLYSFIFQEKQTKKPWPLTTPTLSCAENTRAPSLAESVKIATANASSVTPSYVLKHWSKFVKIAITVPLQENALFVEGSVPPTRTTAKNAHKWAKTAMDAHA
jgi:hypothetical protein